MLDFRAWLFLFFSSSNICPETMIQSSSDGPRYLTIKELSAATGFSVTQIRRLVNAENIPCFQPGGKGGKLLFPPDAMERRGYDENPNGTHTAPKRLSGPLPKWKKP